MSIDRLSPRPNFFLIGAVKGGTTAMSTYLADHANIFFSAPKELHYWNHDHDKKLYPRQLVSLDQYLAIFRDADPKQHSVIAEGSTTYFQSAVAAKEILQFNPEAKFLVMLRNPIQVAQGMHGELVRHFYEDVSDFETAWRLQEDRAKGNQLPKYPVFPHQLQYRDVATFSHQLKILFDAVPPSQRMVVIFDDFIDDPGEVYRQVLEFLGVHDDGRREFQKVHQAARLRFATLMRIYRNPPPLLKKPINFLQSRVSSSSGSMKKWLQRSLSKPQPREKLSDKFASELRATFREDVQIVSEMLSRDLNHWTAGSADVQGADLGKSDSAASTMSGSNR